MASCPVSPLATPETYHHPFCARGCDVSVSCLSSRAFSSSCCYAQQLKQPQCTYGGAIPLRLRGIAYTGAMGSDYTESQPLLTFPSFLSPVSFPCGSHNLSYLSDSVSPIFGRFLPRNEQELHPVTLGTGFRTRAETYLQTQWNLGKLPIAVRRNPPLLPAPFSSRGMYRNRKSFSQCRWNLDASEIPATWGPVMEQLVLCSSVALAYAAGIATPARNSIRRSLFPYPKPSRQTLQEKEKQAELNKPEAVSPTGSVDEGLFMWEEVWRNFDKKLSKVIASMETAGFEGEGPTQSPVLMLQAMAKGPRLRLLRAASQHLCREVLDVADTSKSLDSASWLKLSLDTLCNLVVPVCRYWLSQELTFDITDPQGVMPIRADTQATSTAAKILADDTEGGIAEFPFVVDYFWRNGKAELYADFLFFLRFRTVRPGSICSFKSFVRFAEYLFEDLVISVADAATEIYVNRSSADISGIDSDDWPALLRPSLSSTRSLERFRNEVALRSWLRKNFASVEAMYEDRFELWTLQKSLLNSQAPKSKVKGSPQENTKDLILTRWKLPARRSKELKALSGWRYNYSLYLELSDIVGPLLRALLTKLGDAISFLLVRLIGRSLGLIYRGVRQSVKWSP